MNLISLAIFLSLSVHNTYVQLWLWGCLFFAKFLRFSHNFHFFAKFSHFLFRKKFRIIFSQNFRIIVFAKLFFSYFFAKYSHFLFRENFRIFREWTKCEKKDFTFSLETLNLTPRKGFVNILRSLSCLST